MSTNVCDTDQQQLQAIDDAQFREVLLVPDPYAGVLSSQKNTPGQLNRPLVNERSFANTAVRTLLRSVQYGTAADGTPLCLIAFEVIFVFDPSSTRFTHADLIVTFAKGPPPAGGTAPGAVVVTNFCPRRVYGVPSPETRKWTFRTDLITNAAPPPFHVGITPSLSRESSFVRDHMMEVRGLPIANNVVKWMIHENTIQKEGIPDRFTCAVLVGHDNEPFQADVKVIVRANVALLDLPLKAWPWSRDDPLLFRPGAEFAVKVPQRRLEMDKMDNADWLQVVDLPKEHQDEIAYQSC